LVALLLGNYRLAAELGDGLGLAMMASSAQGDEKCRLAELAAAKGEPLGMTVLATCLWSGNGCRADRPRALRLYREAAELGLPWAQYIYADRGFDASDPERFQWWGEAAARRNGPAVDGLRQVAVQYARKGGRDLYEVGCVLECLDLETLNEVGEWTAAQAECIRAAVAHCSATRRRAGRAVRWWTRVGMRLGVARDVRLIIARLLWSQRAAWG
jgi:TPR repeat protein